MNLHALLLALAVLTGTLGLGLLLFFVGYSYLSFAQTKRTMQQVSDDTSSMPDDEILLQKLRDERSFSWASEKAKKWGTQEDRLQLLQAGYRHPQALTFFVLLRIGVGLLLAALFLGLVFTLHHPAFFYFLIGPFLGFALGMLIPKFVLEAKAKNRVQEINGELPFFVDLLALLQGVGMSLEQSLMSVAAASDVGLPLLSKEMREMSKQIAVGRPRVEAMQRLAEVLRDPDFQELVNMLRQIDRYGGEVATPLREFSERLQERRHLALRETAGKMNGKMIVVLVTTMLPGLVIITAGPAFTVLIEALKHL